MYNSFAVKPGRFFLICAVLLFIQRFKSSYLSILFVPRSRFGGAGDAGLGEIGSILGFVLLIFGVVSDWAGSPPGPGSSHGRSRSAWRSSDGGESPGIVTRLTRTEGLFCSGSPCPHFSPCRESRGASCSGTSPILFYFCGVAGNWGGLSPGSAGSSGGPRPACDAVLPRGSRSAA